VGLILQIREVHPAMGLRTMYEYYRPDDIGRDAFISIGIHYGFRTKVFRNEARTTFSSPYSRYRNLLVGKELKGCDQLWTSDLTYFKVGENFFYIVFIMDVYSRTIVGYSVADNMRAENNVAALQMAFKYRKRTGFDNSLIHHSDRGGQYISEQYVGLLNNAKIQISMCNEVYENAHIERVNGTIKNMYLQHWGITNFKDLQKQLKRAVDTYNNCRPHSSIAGMSPVAFEQYIKELDVANRPTLPIWTRDSSEKQNSNQCLIQF
jgi:transposase InsO family protein